MAPHKEPTAPIPPAPIGSVEDLSRLANLRALCRTGAARVVRKSHGLSLKEVADGLHLPPSTVLRWETGQRAPHGEPAVRYGELLERLMGDR